MSITKSGAQPVIPNTVVFKYFSWPARSTKLTTFEAWTQISSHINFLPPWRGCVIGLDFESKPRISIPTLDVRPDSISCLCLRGGWMIQQQQQRQLTLTTIMRLPKQVYTGLASSIIQDSFGQNAEQSWLVRGVRSWNEIMLYFYATSNNVPFLRPESFKIERGNIH